jgi:protein-tyrosine phosphatase
VTEAPLDPPLRVDWLTDDDLPDARPGRLGLTFLPGKHGASVRYPGRVYRRDLETDFRALAEAGVTTLVLLVEDGELARWGDPSIVERGARSGLRVLRWPLADGTAPRTFDAMDELLGDVDAARTTGNVGVACMGGVGRTGTVAACAMVALGRTADAAIARVRAVRHPSAVETSEQIGFVRGYERHVAERLTRSATVAP